MVVIEQGLAEFLAAFVIIALLVVLLGWDTWRRMVRP